MVTPLPSPNKQEIVYPDSDGQPMADMDCLEQSLLLFRLGHVSQADAQQLQDV